MTKQMSYVANNLLPNETIVKQAEIHWSIYIGAITMTVIFLPIVFAMATGAENIPFDTFCIILALLVFPWLWAYITKFSTELAVTNKRVIAKKGLISRKTIELNLNKVESLTINQGIIGRLFNCGTLIINGTGGVRTPFKAIDDPLSFRKAVNEQIETR